MRTLALLLAFLWVQVTPPAQTAKAVVTGNLRLSDGSLASGVRVAAVPVDSNNVAVLMNLGLTDPSGAYRLEGVPPGRYYLTAGPLESPTYFPGVKTQADARILTVAEGATLGAMDFVVLMLPAFRVSGRLGGVPREAPPDLLSAWLVPNDRSVAQILAAPRLTTPVASDGKFEFSKVTPGSYDLRILYGNTLLTFATATRIQVGDSNVTDVASTAGPILFGRVSLEGGGNLPESSVNNAGLPGISSSTLISIGAGKLGECCSPTFVVRPDGWFVAALRSDNYQGDFQIFVSQLPFGLYVRSIMSSATDLLRTPLKIAGGTTSFSIEVTLTKDRPIDAPSGMRLSGKLTGLSAAFSGSVLLRGKVPDIQSALGVVDLQHIGQVPLAPDGSFVFENVPPGSYEFRAITVPSGTVLRTIAIPRHNVDRVEVKLSDPEIAMLQGVRTVISINPNSLPQIPIPPDPESTTSDNLGSLTVSQSGSGPMFIEGSYSYFLVISAGSIVEEKRLAGNSTSFSLPAGDYELRAYVRPCDGNCGNLDPPMDECRATFALKPGEALSVNKSISGHSCTLKFSSPR